MRNASDKAKRMAVAAMAAGFVLMMAGSPTMASGRSGDAQFVGLKTVGGSAPAQTQPEPSKRDHNHGNPTTQWTRVTPTVQNPKGTGQISINASLLGLIGSILGVIDDPCPY